MLELPLNRWKLLLPLIVLAFLSGTLLDRLFGASIDYWIHDSALVYQARQDWRYAAVVVLDDDVPLDVGRKQALPLFAQAADRIIAAGGQGIYFDAVVAKSMEGRMPYAVCIEPNGNVRWSEPSCVADTPSGSCRLGNSEWGNAPLRMAGRTLQSFRIAPYFHGQEQLPDFLLYGLESSFAIPEHGLVASDRLVAKDGPIAWWMDLSPDHAVVALAKFIVPDADKALLIDPDDQSCDQQRRCRRIRLSRPQFTLSESGSRPMIPVSRLASCDARVAERTAALFKDKVVIFQMAAPNEASDVFVSPMTIGWFGPHALTPGAQFLADAVETLLNRDHPRSPALPIKASLLLAAALIGVLSGAYLKQLYVWMIGVLLFIGVASLCYLNATLQLWPVTATMTGFIVGVIGTVGIHLALGAREGQLIIKYMPRQIHNLLISLKPNETFQNQRREVLVLMSDLAGYTSVTGFIKDPAFILELMNDYLNETSLVLQDKYNGWLENYVGDMVCYYWPYRCDRSDNSSCVNALQGALELVMLQKRFFASIEQRYHRKIDEVALKRIGSVINAGVGLTSGTVVMGDLGPKHGVRKFGILGDPLNLAARIESLTRLFSTEIIITEDFVEAARYLNYPIRRLGCMRVKGRTEPATLYAIGHRDDVRFADDVIAAWEKWLSAIENRVDAMPDCPEIFAKDRQTVERWLQRGLLRESGIWHLDEK
ncbi:MAG: hypothetical protein Kow0065_18630 [Methylomicrobium sp.]